MSAVLRRLLGIRVPLVQSGMGGVAGPELAAAVSEAGAAGCLALYKEEPQRIGDLVAQVRECTAQPFGVNLIPEVVGETRATDQLAAALRALPPRGFVTFFGLPGRRCAQLLRDHEVPVVVQVGEPAEADEALTQGANALVLQGRQAGGHLLGDRERDELLEKVAADHPDVPLLAAGHSSDGPQWASAIAAGAHGALCGTLFVPAQESRAHPHFKQRVVDATSSDTVVTDVYRTGWPGRRHRVLRTALTDPQGESLPARFIATTQLAQGRVPVARYSAAAPTRDCAGAVEEMAMYCGESADGVQQQLPAAELVAAFDRAWRQAGGA